MLLAANHEHRAGEIGYLLHPDHQGRGYMTEACRPMLELGFTCFGMRRIIGRVEPRNPASWRVLERLGMRREAHFVENEWLRGEWQSELIYALLAAEWRQSQPRLRK
jgi:RimJ/RimL family protein N-acetyltransferase